MLQIYIYYLTKQTKIPLSAKFISPKIPLSAKFISPKIPLSAKFVLEI